MKRRLAIGAAALAVLGAGGVAYAATQSSTPGARSATRNAFLDDVATRLHVTRSQLDQALKAATADQLAAAVKAGRLTQAQANAIQRRLQRTGAVPFLAGPHHGFGFGPLHAGLRAAAPYLGLTPAQLVRQLRSGKSLADVAKARGKSVSGLKSALRDAVKTRLDAAVKAGRITQTQEDRILSRLDARLDAMITRVRPGPGFGAAPPWGGPRFRHGGAPWGSP